MIKEEPSTNDDTEVQKWGPLGSANHKLNIAWRFGQDPNLHGLGVLIHDSNRLVASTLCSKVRREGDALQIHARAVLRALQFAYVVEAPSRG
jgi:hypothetical protein